jgi:hypothetical protein
MLAISVAASGLALLAGGCATTSRTSTTVNETVLDADSQFIVQVVARGRPLRLKVDPGAPWFVLLNGSVARELRLVGTRSANMAVGPVKLKGQTRSEKLTFGSLTASRPVMWFKGESVRDADGVINPANLPWDRVTLRLRPKAANEQAVELPMEFDRERGLYHRYSFGGQLILTRFTLADPLTTTTGAAASVIAKRHDGLWKGGMFTHQVRYGVVRPVRKMVLGKPLSVNGFMLSQMAVRVWDDRGDYRLTDEQVRTEEDDEDILVIGKRGRSFGAPHFWLMVGQDALTKCSSISYDKGSKRLILSCSAATS